MHDACSYYVNRTPTALVFGCAELTYEDTSGGYTPFCNILVVPSEGLSLGSRLTHVRPAGQPHSWNGHFARPIVCSAVPCSRTPLDVESHITETPREMRFLNMYGQGIGGGG